MVKISQIYLKIKELWPKKTAQNTFQGYYMQFFTFFFFNKLSQNSFIPASILIFLWWNLNKFNITEPLS